MFSMRKKRKLVSTACSFLCSEAVACNSSITFYCAVLWHVGPAGPQYAGRRQLLNIRDIIFEIIQAIMH